MDKFSAKNTTKGRSPRLPFLRIKEAVVGKRRSISLVFVGDAEARRLNHIYRCKNKPANVLSFPIDEKNGEIFINLQAAKREAKKFNRTPTAFAGFLFIHALLHLKGMRHGSRMEKAECKWCRKFL